MRLVVVVHTKSHRHFPHFYYSFSKYWCMKGNTLGIVEKEGGFVLYLMSNNLNSRHLSCCGLAAGTVGFYFHMYG